jgi:hypothetical protein
MLTRSTHRLLLLILSCLLLGIGQTSAPRAICSGGCTTVHDGESDDQLPEAPSAFDRDDAATRRRCPMEGLRTAPVRTVLIASEPTRPVIHEPISRFESFAFRQLRRDNGIGRSLLN